MFKRTLKLLPLSISLHSPLMGLCPATISPRTGNSSRLSYRHSLPIYNSSVRRLYFALLYRCTFTVDSTIVLSCADLEDPQIRVIINDGVAPLTGIRGCPEDKDGMCPVDVFVAAQKETIAETDWVYECYGDWTVPPGHEWNTTTGAPSRPQ